MKQISKSQKIEDFKYTLVQLLKNEDDRTEASLKWSKETKHGIVDSNSEGRKEFKKLTDRYILLFHELVNLYGKEVN